MGCWRREKCCDEGGRAEAPAEAWPVTLSGSSITLHHHNTAVTSLPPPSAAPPQPSRNGMLTPAAIVLKTSDARLFLDNTTARAASTLRLWARKILAHTSAHAALLHNRRQYVFSGAEAMPRGLGCRTELSSPLSRHHAPATMAGGGGGEIQ